MSELSHIDEDGAARMVDVGDKSVTRRVAVAEGSVLMQPETAELIQKNALKKGDVISTARLAGVMAAKKTSDLIPLCHPLMITGVDISFELTAPDTLRIEASVKVVGKTGVEMEALTAVSVAALTVYDMAKAVDKEMVITGVKLLEKHGGKSGSFLRDNKTKGQSC
jgi:cyclic pyranopterin phosphate synthase